MGGRASKTVYPFTYPKIEHWSTYKVDEVPVLKEYKASLSADGLKDPWIRNEVWRYRLALPTSPAGYMRVAGYAVALATVLLIVRSKVVPRDKHNEPYIA